MTYARGEFQPYADDVVIIESKDANGNIHAPLDQPAIQILTPDGNDIIGLFYYSHGKQHREDGPAVIIREGGFETKQWFRNGLEHRDLRDGPSFLEICLSDGFPLREEYRTEGKLHRISGPAVLMRDSYSRITMIEEWYTEGRPRESHTSPSAIHRGEDESFSLIYYSFDGQTRSAQPVMQADDLDVEPDPTP